MPVEKSVKKAPIQTESHLGEDRGLPDLVPQVRVHFVLPELEEVQQVVHVLQVQGRHLLQLVRLEQGQVLLGHLLHKHGVVPLGRHPGVGRTEDVAESKWTTI